MSAQLEPPLDAVEIRVLGSLVEKENTTPEYYPLSLNALVNACNQRSNREPVMACEEDDVRSALERLRARGLAFVRTGAGSRVEKFGQRLQEQYNFGRREIAVLAVLMLRGPQTIGELRERAGRMHDFSDLDEVERTLRALEDWLGHRFVMEMPRAAGTREPRWAHLLGGEPEAVPEPGTAPRLDRIAELESRIDQLRSEFEALRSEFDRFRRQFEG